MTVRCWKPNDEQCHCYREFIDIKWEDLEIFDLQPGVLVTEILVEQIFHMQHELFLINYNYKVDSLQNICLQVIDNFDLNVELLPKRLQRKPRKKLWPWARQWDVWAYFRAHVGCYMF